MINLCCFCFVFLHFAFIKFVSLSVNCRTQTHTHKPKCGQTPNLNFFPLSLITFDYLKKTKVPFFHTYFQDFDSFRCQFSQSFLN